MNPCFNSIILGRQAKSIPAHGMQNIKPFCSFPAGNNISRHISLQMADMKPLARRIRKHIQDIKLGRRTIFFGEISFFFFPALLPFFFYFPEWIRHKLNEKYRDKTSNDPHKNNCPEISIIIVFFLERFFNYRLGKKQNKINRKAQSKTKKQFSY